jgi:pyruvate dehydrogenase (quinone)
MSKTAAEFLVDALEKTGLKRVYGVVGDSLNGFTDALRRRKSIDWIHMRHEEAAAFAAGAEAHLTRSLACLKIVDPRFAGTAFVGFGSAMS